MSGVTNMESMFEGADAFNQPLHTWKTGNSESLYSMFYGAAAFNQSIGDWMLNPAVNLNFIFTNGGLDCYHYSETLKGWNANSGTPDGLSLDADGRTYSPGAADARDNLVTTKGWTIAGDAASVEKALPKGLMISGRERIPSPLNIWLKESIWCVLSMAVFQR